MGISSSLKIVDKFINIWEIHHCDSTFRVCHALAGQWPQHTTDALILKLVKKLDGRRFDPDKESGTYQYFRAEPVLEEDKPFRLVFLLVQGEDFLGVINAFRVKARKV